MRIARRCSAKPHRGCSASKHDVWTAMTNWSETYRGTVPPWECDVPEHFTIAYYFDRLEEAERNLADLLGLAELLSAGGFARRLDVRFARELRAASSFHIHSAAPAVDEETPPRHPFLNS